MKNSTCSTLQAAGIAMASWLLPSLSLASVLIDGVCYELDDAAKTAIVAPGSVKYLENLIIPETITVDDISYTVTAIADCAFLDYHNLSKVQIKSHSLTHIGYSAFERCWSLLELEFTEGLESISYEAFKGCFQLETVSLPSTLKTIGDRSFMGCEYLHIINIPASVTNIGDEWLSGCTLYLLIAELDQPLNIEASVFSGLDKQQCILNVPQGCTEAYQTAKVWKDFPSIQEDVLEAGQCGGDVFYTVYADRTMKVWGSESNWNDYEGWAWPFSKLGPSFVETITIEEGVTFIGAYAFCGWEKLSSVTVPNSLTAIEQEVFTGTPFYDNQPDGVVYAGNWAIGVKGVQDADIVVKEGTVGNSSDAFLGSGIASLSIPSSMICIQTSMYGESDDGYDHDSSFGEIGRITVDPDNPRYDSRDNCNAIIETGTNTLLVGSPNMVIPDGVTKIAPFALCRPTSVVIPASVAEVDQFAFCPHVWVIRVSSPNEDHHIFNATPSPIETIKMEASTPPAFSMGNLESKFSYYFRENKRKFGGPNFETCTLYVPQGSKEAYQNAEGWKDFLNIEEYDQGGTTAIENVREQNSTMKQIFDLQGRRLNNASGHSIIIENGKMRIQR
jgi:hypothetical protein